jgi:hypothetical protein
MEPSGKDIRLSNVRDTRIRWTDLWLVPYARSLRIHTFLLGFADHIQK